MSERDYWELDNLLRLRDELDRAVKALDDRAIAELHRRAGLSGKPAAALQEGAGRTLRDGYGGGSSGVAVSTSDVSNSVLATVAARGGGNEDAGTPDTWPPFDDPMIRQVEELFEHLGAAVTHASSIRRIRRRIEDAVGPIGRTSSLQGECLCCGREVAGTATDRLRGGYCDACRKAWERDGRPGSDPQEPSGRRVRWEEDRRQKLRERRAS